MKKIILCFALLILFSTLVSSALPPVPMPVRFFFTHNGVVVQNFKVELTIGSETIIRYTNENGGIGVDVGEGSADFQNADPYADTLTLNCGFSVCNKNYVIRNMDLPYREDFILTEAPPTSCSPCSCGGGSDCYYTETKCRNLYPCEDTECKTCPTCTPFTCICPECEAQTCPTCPSTECPLCELCEPCPEQPIGLSEVISGIIALIVGISGGIYFTKNKAVGKNVGIQIYKGEDGTDKIKHKHPTVIGYHDPKVMHKKAPHEKGEVLPIYEKDPLGNWVYK